MAGQSRRPTSKKNPHAGTGGHNKKRLEGKGPTPPATARKGHPAARAAARKANAGPKVTNRPEAADRQPGGGSRTAARPGRAADGSEVETVVGRNPVLEALRAKVPANRLYVALGIDVDDRVREAVLLAQKSGIETVEVERRDLDRLTSEALHQGLALNVPPYEYAHPDELLERVLGLDEAPLVVALDGVTDPRNLGAAVRSAGAFGAHGMIVPERRAAGITASAWRTSAGAVARLQVAQATNLTRTLVSYQKAGLFVAGLAADGEVSLDDLDLATGGLVVVAGSEGKGLTRLVSETCDVRVSIPMAGPVESLNASVAVSVALAEVARRRRLAVRG